MRRLERRVLPYAALLELLACQTDKGKHAARAATDRSVVEMPPVRIAGHFRTGDARDVSVQQEQFGFLEVRIVVVLALANQLEFIIRQFSG